MTLAFASAARIPSLRCLALLLAVGLGAPGSAAALPPASDSLTISGVVLSHTGARQPAARVRVVRHSPIAAGAAWLVAATWTNQRGEFTLKIDPARAADSLLIQAFCAAQPHNINYVWGAVLTVEADRRQPYIINLKKRRIYPKVR